MVTLLVDSVSQNPAAIAPTSLAASIIRRVVRARERRLVLEMVVEAQDPLVFVVLVRAQPMFIIGWVVGGRKLWKLLFISRDCNLCRHSCTM